MELTFHPIKKKKKKTRGSNDSSHIKEKTVTHILVKSRLAPLLSYLLFSSVDKFRSSVHLKPQFNHGFPENQ